MLFLLRLFQIGNEVSLDNNLLSSIKKERNYVYEDEITCSKECLPDYENKVAK